MKNIKQKSGGQVMLLTVILLSGAVLASTSLACLLILYQLRQAIDTKGSAQAIFAADSGIEWAFYNETRPQSEQKSYPQIINLTNDSKVTITKSPTDPLPIKSIGQYGRSARAFQANLPSPESTTPWTTCGDTITFTYKGSSVTYGTVKSRGKCWLDRNLGASRVATAYNDSEAYGDLFQWGRLDDGHQIRTSGTTIILSNLDNPGHSNFIKAPNSPYDWRSPQNNNLWQGVSGINNPCPSGWRIPTKEELDIELASWGWQQNYNGAYTSPLKLTVGGLRGYGDATLDVVGSYGEYWSNTIGELSGFTLGFGKSNATVSSRFGAYSFSVRCLKD